MKNVLKKFVGIGALTCLMTGFAPSASALVVLPSPNCGNGTGYNCLNFGDFSVYSLALLNLAATGSASNPNPGDPFYVKSAPGELGQAGYIVYGTGTNNGGVVNNNNANMDNAFATPSGGTASFDTTTATEPNPAFTGDQTGYWNATTSAIRSTLGGGQFAIYFNLNDTGNDNLKGIDLLAWGQIVLTGAGKTDLVFTLTGNPGDTTAPNPLAGAGSATADAGVGDPSDPRWVYVHGTICARQAAPGVPEFLHFGPCTGSDPADARNLNQNLGANQAAFSIFNAQLSSLIMDPLSGYTDLSLRYIFGQENNGYEQLFSGQTQVVSNCPLNDPSCFPPIPEPNSIALTGLALASLAVFRRRKAPAA